MKRHHDIYIYLTKLNYYLISVECSVLARTNTTAVFILAGRQISGRTNRPRDEHNLTQIKKSLDIVEFSLGDLRYRPTQQGTTIIIS